MLSLSATVSMDFTNYILSVRGGRCNTLTKNGTEGLNIDQLSPFMAVNNAGSVEVSGSIPLGSTNSLKYSIFFRNYRRELP